MLMCIRQVMRLSINNPTTPLPRNGIGALIATTSPMGEEFDKIRGPSYTDTTRRIRHSIRIHITYADQLRSRLHAGGQPCRD